MHRMYRFIKSTTDKQADFVLVPAPDTLPFTPFYTLDDRPE